jgi:ATP-dependent DNA helicase DinG
MPAVPPRILLPDAPSVVAGVGRAAIVTGDGEVLDLGMADARDLLRTLPPPLLVHAPATLRRLGLPGMPALDLLELFAFVLPARPVAPTPRGLALALDMTPPGAGAEAAAAMLLEMALALLARLSAGRELIANRLAAGLAARMGEVGWDWAVFVMAALGRPAAAASADGLRVWKRLPEWEEAAPPPPPSSLAVAPGEARARLATMLGAGAEQRPGQADYAAAAAAAFAPREVRGDPHLVLAEAGTGTGKTLGYIAPASLWAERNKAPVWISTFTRHLQRQVESELARLVPDPVERRRRVVVRKGRENYLCLLNFEDAVGAAVAGSLPQSVIPLGLVARWAMATSDGDIQGGDLPGWFADLFGAGVAAGLADRRGECIHAGCPHWRKCFVEHTVRRARTADLVVANHALVMAQAAWGGIDDNVVPARYVFDEGHHVFDAADSAFSAEFSGIEAAELRRWLLGAEGGRSRARGLRRRLEDLVAGKLELEAPLEAALQAARALPAPGWSMRLSSPPAQLSGADAARPNPSELFLDAARGQLLARVPGEGEPKPGVIECDLYPVNAELPDIARFLARSLGRLEAPLKTLAQRLEERLDDEAAELDAALRNRIEATCRSLRRRAIDALTAWQAMLQAVSQPQPEPGVRPEHVLFLRLDRREAGDRDVGLHRHWLDPTIPFATVLARPAQGLLVTSATLRDSGARDGGAEDVDAAWLSAEARVGATHLPSPAIRIAVASPFDYAAQTRAFVISDVNTRDMAPLAAAFRTLFVAAGGGALGLFTAISRLRAVHARIAPDLEAAGIPLLAQHVDAMDNATLVDVFRTEEDSCLLGTDAMRDGVDVPGRSLRLVVFERVPWPRPDILHRERRVHLSDGDPGGFDDRVVRFRLRQAFGRLIRSATDRGVFVLLDRQTPTRLLSAFPAGVQTTRLGLAAAAQATHDFLEGA